MKCKYSEEQINNFFDGNVTIDDSNAIIEHMKSCEECRVYYSSLALTGKIINNNEKLKVNIYSKIEASIDKNKYSSKKKWFYKLSSLFSGYGYILKPAAIAVLICFLAVFTIQYGGQISNYLNNHINTTSTGNGNESSIETINDVIKQTGGINAKLTVQAANTTKPSKEELLQTKNIIDKRLDNIGLTEHFVSIDNDKSCLNITAAWANNQKDATFESTLKDLVQKGQLTYQEVDEDKVSSNGNYLPTGKIIVSNKDIAEVRENTDQSTNQKIIILKFNEEGTKKFADATKKLLNQTIAVFVDDKLIMAPRVNAQITNGTAMINGFTSINEENVLLSIINSEALTANIKVSEYKSIEPVSIPQNN